MTQVSSTSSSPIGSQQYVETPVVQSATPSSSPNISAADLAALGMPLTPLESGADALPAPSDAPIESADIGQLIGSSEEVFLDINAAMLEAMKLNQQMKQAAQSESAAASRASIDASLVAEVKAKDAAEERADAANTDAVSEIVQGSVQAGSAGLALKEGGEGAVAARAQAASAKDAREVGSPAEEPAPAASLQSESATDETDSSEEPASAASKDDLALEKQQHLDAAKESENEFTLHRERASAYSAMGQGLSSIIKGSSGLVSADEREQADLDEVDEKVIEAGGRGEDMVAQSMKDLAESVVVTANKADETLKAIIQSNHDTNEQIAREIN